MSEGDIDFERGLVMAREAHMEQHLRRGRDPIHRNSWPSTNDYVIWATLTGLLTKVRKARLAEAPDTDFEQLRKSSELVAEAGNVFALVPANSNRRSIPIRTGGDDDRPAA